MNTRLFVDVFTGEVKAGADGCELTSHAIGSCVVVTAYDRKQKVGAMAHIMLPGKAPLKPRLEKTKYAADAVKKMMELLQGMGASMNALEICLIGGGNVLKREDCRISSDNLFSIEKILRELGFTVKKHAVGGIIRRTARLDTGNGCVYYSEDGSEEKLLWKSEGGVPLKQDGNRP